MRVKLSLDFLHVSIPSRILQFGLQFLNTGVIVLQARQHGRGKFFPHAVNLSLLGLDIGIINVESKAQNTGETKDL